MTATAVLPNAALSAGLSLAQQGAAEIESRKKAAAILFMILSPRMKLLVYVHQPLRVHVRVNLGRANVGVAQELLNHPEVGSAFQQMRCKRVTQHVRTDSFPKSRRLSQGLQPAPKG